jgi:predicted CxxxxCH...CXXCH cytochrome family protein
VDSAASNQQPVWTRVGTGEAACGACHGIPPGAPHSPDSRCQVCHRKAYVKGLLDKTMHANGTVEVNYGCSGCHGGGDNAAPPLDLSGNTDESLPTVGAHQAHLRAFDGFSAPVACSECHQVPARFDDPGHVDHLPPATVFPDAAGVGTLARKAGAAPVYDPATGTCSSVYCHGNGLTFTGDLSPGLIRSPSWTGGASQIVCGSCHGIPPTGHKAGTTLFACARCHRQTIDATGAIVVKTDAASGARSSTHIDGNLTLGSSP